MHTKQLPINLGCHCGVGQLSFNPSLNFLKFHLNSCLTPPLPAATSPFPEGSPLYYIIIALREKT